ncbi:hypothetical protein HY623_03735 [Candidatus Uhrbacteria bacterium]|nr:hypothetical protein [Candidatus Uhrbacteria bacterium]
MKIVLVITNFRGKKTAFISQELRTYPLEQAVTLAREGKIEDAHVVHRGTTSYIRTNTNVPKDDEFDTISITARNLLLYAQGHGTKALPLLDAFVTLYRARLKKKGRLITPVGQPSVLLSGVLIDLREVKRFVFNAARRFDIDPYLLGAILIDEIARLKPFEEIIDALGVHVVGRNVSVGIGQVEIDTANNIIKIGLYHPNPNDQQLPFRRLDRESRTHLYGYLIDSKHNIFFAAAVIKDIIVSWTPAAGDKMTSAVIATLYSKGGMPHPNPASNKRGDQIAGEFYDLARSIIKNS